MFFINLLPPRKKRLWESTQFFRLGSALFALAAVLTMLAAGLSHGSPRLAVAALGTILMMIAVTLLSLGLRARRDRALRIRPILEKLDALDHWKKRQPKPEESDPQKIEEQYMDGYVCDNVMLSGGILCFYGMVSVDKIMLTAGFGIILVTVLYFRNRYGL